MFRLKEISDSKGLELQLPTLLPYGYHKSKNDSAKASRFQSLVIVHQALFGLEQRQTDHKNIFRRPPINAPTDQGFLADRFGHYHILVWTGDFTALNLFIAGSQLARGGLPLLYFMAVTWGLVSESWIPTFAGCIHLLAPPIDYGKFVGISSLAMAPSSFLGPLLPQTAMNKTDANTVFPIVGITVVLGMAAVFMSLKASENVKAARTFSWPIAIGIASGWEALLPQPMSVSGVHSAEHVERYTQEYDLRLSQSGKQKKTETSTQTAIALKIKLTRETRPALGSSRRSGRSISEAHAEDLGGYHVKKWCSSKSKAKRHDTESSDETELNGESGLVDDTETSKL